jgi:hypothetical protein
LVPIREELHYRLLACEASFCGIEECVGRRFGEQWEDTGKRCPYPPVAVGSVKKATDNAGRMNFDRQPVNRGDRAARAHNGELIGQSSRKVIRIWQRMLEHSRHPLLILRQIEPRVGRAEHVENRSI